MRNLQIILWAVIAAAYLIVSLLIPSFHWWALGIAVALGLAVAAIFGYMRRNQNIQDYTMEETGVIGLGLGAGKKKGNEKKV